MENKAWSEKFIKYAYEMGYRLEAVNGQRIITHSIYERPNVRELFIRNLNCDLKLEDIFSLFDLKGQIYKIRLLVHYDERNRTYCYVQYLREEGRMCAMSAYNNFYFRGKKLAVMLSFDNRRIYVDKIPKTISVAEIENNIRWQLQEFKNYNIKISPPSSIYFKNRGFAFLEFASHEDAARARRMNLHINDQNLKMDWAEMLPNVNNEEMLKVTVLFVTYLCDGDTKNELKKYFNNLFKDGRQIKSIVKVSYWAYIYFYRRIDAEFALTQSAHVPHKGKILEISWAIPKIFMNVKHHYNQDSVSQLEHYKSLPASKRRIIRSLRS